jgi:hypothetical protein
MGNALAVEQEMRAYGLAKWEAVIAGGSQAGSLCVEEVRSRTPVLSGSLKNGVCYDIKKLGPFIFKIGIGVDDSSNSDTGEPIKAYSDCIEFSGNCPKGQTNRVPRFMFRGGSQSAKPQMDNLLASLF